eukprot:scaffold6466_cov38-Attheya_sp.AAC.3
MLVPNLTCLLGVFVGAMLRAFGGRLTGVLGQNWAYHLGMWNVERYNMGGLKIDKDRQTQRRSSTRGFLTRSFALYLCQAHA